MIKYILLREMGLEIGQNIIVTKNEHTILVKRLKSIFKRAMEEFCQYWPSEETHGKFIRIGLKNTSKLLRIT